MNLPLTEHLPDEAATAAFARRLAAELGPGAVIALIGPLGAGKTSFVKGVAGELGVEEEVTSPSFVRMHFYTGSLPICHLDLYRVSGTAEFLALAFDEWLDTAGITLIEWADRVADVLPGHTITVSLDYAEEGGRHLTVSEGPPS